MEIWGLTGGVASGKSTAAKIFKELGIPVIDADRVAQSLTEPGGAAYDAIVREFGTANRSQLRKIIFKDPEARSRLEDIVHPLIQSESENEFRRRIEEETHRAGSAPSRLLYEAALLVETGRYKDMQGLIVVEAPVEERLKRLMDRDGISRELAQQMMGAQATDEDRRAVATAVLFNHGSPEQLRSAVEATVNSWKQPFEGQSRK